MQVIVQNAIGKVEWCPETRCVVKTFAGHVKGDPMKEIFNAGADVLERNRADAWLSDNSQL